MIADAADLQVWLDSQPNAVQTVVVPYVRSARDLKLDYRMSVTRRSTGGRSQIVQGGSVATRANTPTALSQVAMKTQQDDRCQIEIALREGATDLGVFQFACIK